ncbi:fatty acid desaturase family protein [Nostoc sp. UHCC 0870]|uniref:fatty acid desaturase family protein n=1 Tax=Nostoc sp. UHCC 0870 TaxID=2914041 RepID=UPI001EDE8F79|nr:fatty acid desaturase [Nostoc sp. UHCC 0870]UKO99882.1 fatty acid desaturase [Nostoc sp. UHCC 0870]
MMRDRTHTNISTDLQQVTADLHQVNPGVGLLRFSLVGLVFISCVALAWLMQNNILFVSATIIAGISYCFWLVCTHDMSHCTLTGWIWFDTVIPRLISWPMLWPYSLYAELHGLHHGWNGSDFRDPERVQWTWQEYQQAHPILQWYVRHQWGCDIFLLGGLGLIIKTFMMAVRLQNLSSRMRRQLLLDVSGMLMIQVVLLTIVILHGELLRYILFWVMMERVIGIIMQTRDHLEHYALWGKFTNHQLTQLYTSRNLRTIPLLGWFMGGLNYHAVHHAFPGIPFNQLPAAFERVQGVLVKHGLPPMQLDSGYIKSSYELSHHPSLIGEATTSEICGDRMMLI